MAMPKNVILHAAKCTRYSLFFKYEKSKLAQMFSRRISFSPVVLWWPRDSSPVSTLGSNEHDKIQVKNTIPAIDRKVILHEGVLFNRTCMTGLIIRSPPPGPVTASPVTKERFFMKYLCKTIKTTKNTHEEPKAKRMPYEKYIKVRLGACDVTMRAAVEMKPPVIAMIRGLNLSQRTPTTGPNIPVDPYAREPTQAVRRENKIKFKFLLCTVTWKRGCCFFPHRN